MSEKDSFIIISPEISQEVGIESDKTKINETDATNLELQKNVSRLIELGKEKTAESAQEALSIIDNVTNLLFKDNEFKPTTKEEELAKKAAEARFAAGGRITIWGEKRDEVHIAGPISIKTKEDLAVEEALVDQKQLIQEACNAGLQNKLQEIVNGIAVTEVSKVQVKFKLLELAGDNFSASSEKHAVFQSINEDLLQKEKNAKYWTAARTVDVNRLPEVTKVNDLISRYAH